MCIAHFKQWGGWFPAGKVTLIPMGVHYISLYSLSSCISRGIWQRKSVSLYSRCCLVCAQNGRGGWIGTSICSQGKSMETVACCAPPPTWKLLQVLYMKNFLTYRKCFCKGFVITVHLHTPVQLPIVNPKYLWKKAPLVSAFCRHKSRCFSCTCTCHLH